MTQQKLLADLSDDDVMVEVRRLAAAERQATAALLRALIELDARRLYLREGCASLFTYCTRVLHLAEGAAYNRIETARAARRFPAILDAIEAGALTLTAARLLAPQLTPDNCHDVLASARHKSKREVEEVIAALRPRPSAPPVMRKLPVIQARTPASAASDARTPSGESMTVVATYPNIQALATVQGSQATRRDDRACRPRAASVTPLAPARYKVQLTVSRETYDKVRRTQDLLRHSSPDGDLAVIFDRAMTLLLEELERRRCAATPSPRALQPGPNRSRNIPAGVRRAVWARDGGRCAFVSPNGQRCRESGLLEFHHVQPYAAGGDATTDNIQLRCRRHNAYEAMCSSGSTDRR